MARKYVRFVVNETDKVTGGSLGFFTTAYELRRWDRLVDEDLISFSSVLDWFSEHLEVPDRFARSSKPRAHGKAVSWFKPEAIEHIEKSRALLEIMKRYGIHSKMLTTDRPGYIIFEDDWQVTAIPFRDR